MRVTFTGNGTAGSWKIRGEQIAAALNVPAIPRIQHFQGELLVVVKRVPDNLSAILRGRPWVWDVVDAYPQPLSSEWTEREAKRWLKDTINRLSPTAIIWPNRQMMQDAEFDGPQTVIYHHARPGGAINPVRERVSVVGYEGSRRYIEQWAPHIDAECRKRNWRFVINPGSLSDCDIVLALRGEPFSGYVPKHWKSNVKLANAHATGTPFVGALESGYIETASGAEYWAETPGQLRMAFDWLTDQSAREQVSDRFRQKTITLEKAAAEYGAFLYGL